MTTESARNEHDCQCDSDRIRRFFRGHGLRCTRQRELIYSALAQSKTHPTAEDLFQTVRGHEPGLSLATVYNTLEIFIERGICRRLPSAVGNGPSRYDADVAHHAHVMLEDGRVFDVPHDLAARLEESMPPRFRAELERRLGVQLTGVHIQFSARADTNSGDPSK